MNEDNKVKSNDKDGTNNKKDMMNELSLKLKIIEEKYLIFPKIMYLIIFISIAFISPFFTVIYESKGIPSSEIGILVGLYPIFTTISSFILPMIADRIKEHKIILILAYLGTALVAPVFIYVNSFYLFLFFVPIYALLNGGTSPLNDAYVLFIVKDKIKYGKQRMFGAIGFGIGAAICGVLVALFNNNYTVAVVCYIITQLFVALVILPIGLPRSIDSKKENDDVIEYELDEYDLIENSGNNSLLNEVDLFVEKDQDNTKLEKEKNDDKENIKTDDDDDDDDDDLNILPDEDIGYEDEEVIDKHDRISVLKKSLENEPYYKKILLTLLNIPMITFLIITFTMAIGQAIIQNFLFLFLVDEFDADSTLLGLTIFVTVLFEIPIFYFASFLLTKLGYKNMVILAHCAYITRVLVYSVINNAWLVFTVEWLHGITFGCQWLAGINFIAAVTPKGTEGTFQGIYSGSYFGLGRAVGSIIGGFIYDIYGPRIMFITAACFIFISLIFFTLCHQKQNVNYN